MEIRRSDLVVLFNTLNKLSEEKLPIKVAYKLAKVKKQLEDEVKTYEELKAKAVNLISEFEAKRMALVNKYAKKDEDGNVITEGNSVVIEPSKQREFEQKIKDLKEEYKDQLSEFEKLWNEYIQFMDEVTNLDLITFSIDEFPEDLPITIQEMEYLSLLIQ